MIAYVKYLVGVTIIFCTLAAGYNGVYGSSQSKKRYNYTSTTSTGGSDVTRDRPVVQHGRACCGLPKEEGNKAKSADWAAGTEVCVTNKGNGYSVTVTIIKGEKPIVAGYIIVLSENPALAIGIPINGEAEVVIEVVNR